MSAASGGLKSKKILSGVKKNVPLQTTKTPSQQKRKKVHILAKDIMGKKPHLDVPQLAQQGNLQIYYSE